MVTRATSQAYWPNDPAVTPVAQTATAKFPLLRINDPNDCFIAVRSSDASRGVRGTPPCDRQGDGTRIPPGKAIAAKNPPVRPC